MKPLSTCLVFCMLLLMASCGRTEASLQSTSPNGKATLTVTGKRIAAVEPWTIEMKVKAYTFKEGFLKFEIYAGDLNAETVKFNWTDEYHCTITFVQRDNTERHFQLIASPDQLQMAEV